MYINNKSIKITDFLNKLFWLNANLTTNTTHNISNKEILKLINLVLKQ